jgi:hypothetical protein
MLDPNNTKSIKKDWYSTEILKEFDRNYEKQLTAVWHHGDFRQALKLVKSINLANPLQTSSQETLYAIVACTH